QALAGKVDEVLNHPDARANPFRTDLLARHDLGDRFCVLVEGVPRREGRHCLHLSDPTLVTLFSRRFVLAGAFFSSWPGQLLTWWVRSRGATVSLARARLCGSGRTTVARFAGTAGLATTRFTVVPNMFHALAQSIHQVVDLRLSLLFLRSDYI